MKTTFYYALLPEQLLNIKDQCTIWMPENQPSTTNIWNTNQVIATCDLSYLFQARELIIMGELSHNDVIWIEVNNQEETNYLFNAIGKIEPSNEVAYI